MIEALRGRALDSLLASFGDRRPSLEPVIGVGDYVAVSVWEAGSGGLFSGPLVADRFSAGSKSALIPEQVVSRDGAISRALCRAHPGRRAPDPGRPGPHRDRARRQGDPAPGPGLGHQGRSRRSVTVTGEVAAGARVPLSGKGDRILDVVAGAGGVRAPVNETFVRLSRGTLTATVPMTTVVSNPRENIFLRPSDVLTLVRDPQTFLAVGALGNATEIPFQAEGITLAQALAKSRGLSDFQADPAGTFIFRFEPAASCAGSSPAAPCSPPPLVPVVYRINMRDPNSLFLTQAFRMRNRDLVYVSNAPFTEVQKVLSVFSTVTAPVTPPPRLLGLRAEPADGLAASGRGRAASWHDAQRRRSPCVLARHPARVRSVRSMPDGAGPWTR